MQTITGLFPTLPGDEVSTPRSPTVYIDPHANTPGWPFLSVCDPIISILGDSGLWTRCISIKR